MSNKNNRVLACLAGLSAAVTALSIGGYFLHKKVLKHRLREQARRQAMNVALFDLNNGEVEYDDFEDYGDEDGDDDYYDELFKDFDGNLQQGENKK